MNIKIWREIEEMNEHEGMKEVEEFGAVKEIKEVKQIPETEGMIEIKENYQTEEMEKIPELKYLLEESLILDGNKTVTELPVGPSINGVLSLQHCISLRRLPEKLSVAWDLDVSYSGIESFPREMNVDGDIIASYSRLRSIANLNLTCKNLILTHCESLEEMPEHLKVNGDLDLSYCTSLKELPHKLIVHGNLCLQHTQITALPEYLLVGGDICLNGTPITQLPSHMQVGGYLDLSDCSQLKALPPQLQVRTFLNLANSGVEAFTDAEDLQVGGVVVSPSGTVIVRKNGRMKAIPNPTDDLSPDYLLQQSKVPLDAVFIANGYFVSYENKLWRIIFKRNQTYIVEDLCYGTNEEGSYILYKGDDGRYELNYLSDVPTEEFLGTWFGELFL